MQIDRALEILKQTRTTLLTGSMRSATNLESVAHLEPAKRMGLGLSQIKSGDYQIEIRIERLDGRAAEEAERIKKDADGEARIIYMENARVGRNRDADIPACHECLGGAEPVGLTPGVSISHEDGSAGSLGLFMNHNDGIMLVSCAHVLAPGSAARNDAIHHPAGDDVPVVLSEHEVARLKTYSKFNKNKPNPLDAALALVNEDANFIGNVIPKGVKAPSEGRKIRGIATLDDIQNEYVKRAPIAKLGRSTGCTTGVISAFYKSFPLSVSNIVYEFQDLIEIEWTKGTYSLPGDSGGLIYDPEKMVAIGMHFASSEYTDEKRTVSFGCLFHHVLKTWKTELFTK